MKDESPIAAVNRVMEGQFGITPSAIQAMMLIEAVHDVLPPHPDATIASLRAILGDVTPHSGLEIWARTCAEKIVTCISKQQPVRDIAIAVANEAFWCCLEGTLAGMLLRVTRGLDLETDPKTTL